MLIAQDYFQAPTILLLQWPLGIIYKIDYGHAQENFQAQTMLLSRWPLGIIAKLITGICYFINCKIDYGYTLYMLHHFHSQMMLLL